MDYLLGSVNSLAGVIMIVVFLELGFLALWLAVGSARQRRSYFWVRLFLASLALPVLMAALVGIARLNVLSDNIAKAVLSTTFVVGVVALMFVPGLLYRRSGSSPGPPESDGGGGPGRGPGRPPSSPDAPRGGIPLPDADPASARARDHNAPKFDQLKRRRPAHRPGRIPRRTRR